MRVKRKLLFFVVGLTFLISLLMLVNFVVLTKVVSRLGLDLIQGVRYVTR